MAIATGRQPAAHCVGNSLSARPDQHEHVEPTLFGAFCLPWVACPPRAQRTLERIRSCLVSSRLVSEILQAYKLNQSINESSGERTSIIRELRRKSLVHARGRRGRQRLEGHTAVSNGIRHMHFFLAFLFFRLVSRSSSRSSTRSEKKGTYPPCLFCGGAWQGRDQSAVERIQFSAQRSGCGRAGCAFSSRLVCSERSRRVRRNEGPKTGSHCCACAE